MRLAIISDTHLVAGLWRPVPRTRGNQCSIDTYGGEGSLRWSRRRVDVLGDRAEARGLALLTRVDRRHNNHPG